MYSYKYDAAWQKAPQRDKSFVGKDHDLRFLVLPRCGLAFSRRCPSPNTYSIRCAAAAEDSEEANLVIVGHAQAVGHTHTYLQCDADADAEMASFYASRSLGTADQPTPQKAPGSCTSRMFDSFYFSRPAPGPISQPFIVKHLSSSPRPPPLVFCSDLHVRTGIRVSSSRFSVYYAPGARGTFEPPVPGGGADSFFV